MSAATADRNAGMFAARLSGDSWASIGARHGVSSERARQIVYALAAQEYLRIAAGAEAPPEAAREAPGSAEVPT